MRKTGKLSSKLRKTLGKPISGKKPSPEKRPGKNWQPPKPAGKRWHWTSPMWMRKITGSNKKRKESWL